MIIIIFTIAALIAAILLYKKGRRDALKDERTTQYYNNPVDEHSPENLDLNGDRYDQPLEL